jgi:hypothetical protein
VLVVQYVLCVCRLGVVKSYVAGVFLVPEPQAADSLPYVNTLACVAFECVNAACVVEVFGWGGIDGGK